jgi:hypothetical protein
MTIVQDAAAGSEVRTAKAGGAEATPMGVERG